MVRSIAILASSDLKVGSGHVSRQISLAEKAVARGWDVTFVGKFPNSQIPERLRNLIAVINLKSSSSLDEHLKALEHIRESEHIDCVFIDNYRLLEPLSSKALRDKLPPQVQFEDGIENENTAKMIVNSGVYPTLHQDFIQRLNERSKVSLLGPDAAVIGEKIWETRDARQRAGANNGTGTRGMINFGKSDTAQQVTSILENLSRSPSLSSYSWELIANSPGYETALSYPALRLKVFDTNHGPSDFYACLASCNFAVGGAGVSSYERAFLGIPSINFPLAENQAGIANILSECKAAVKGELSTSWFNRHEIDFANLLNPESALSMAKSGMSLVDGYGASRILDMSEEV